MSAAGMWLPLVYIAEVVGLMARSFACRGL
jgi:hypothetical protein